MIKKVHDKAGEKVLIEEYLRGQEISYIAFMDGKTFLPLETAKDHKPLLDFGLGPMTGGMGVVSPSPIMTPELELKIKKLIPRLIRVLRKAGIIYKGIIYFGLMIVDGEPYVLEFNVRFGDPETQPQMLRLKSDIVPVMLACLDGTLGNHKIKWDPRPAVGVVMA